MSNKVTLGGERLGTGGKVQVELDGYGRSTHDISEVFRSTMASGTLVPFMNIVGLPGDKFDIDLELDVKTHPTIGPLFGRYKVQLDVFEVPLHSRGDQYRISASFLMTACKISTTELSMHGIALQHC